MRLVVLTDNNTFIDQYYTGEPGACYYLEDGETKILLDTGYSNVFVKNAAKHGIDLGAVDYIAISHGHDDHTRGLKYFPATGKAKKPRIIAHPDVFSERVDNGVSIGCPVDKVFLEQRFGVTLTSEPLSISDNILFLGEIPAYNDFERTSPIGNIRENGRERPDFIRDDTALVYKGSQGLFIVTGCSHSGICNIVEHAKKVCGTDSVQGVIGGFHLLQVTEQVEKTVRYFEENDIRELYPCHCVCFAAKAEIHGRIPIHEVGVGLELLI